MKTTFSLATLLSLASFNLVSCGSDSDEIIEPPIRWEYVWSDEFDGAAGTLPSPEYWTFDVGGDGWGNDQLEYNTDRATNASLDGLGNLAITARDEAFEGNDYTSARIKTLDKFEQENGLFEARIRLPRGQGVWPAFWMLGGDHPEVGWPDAGEIDIMEYRGQDPSVIHGSLHGPGYSGSSPITTTFRLPDDEPFYEDFHVFAVEWDPSRISWSVDGEVFQIVTFPEVINRGDWVFDHPFFILLNVAIGGSFVGRPDATTPLPQTMLVDYVRVFERR